MCEESICVNLGIHLCWYHSPQLSAHIPTTDIRDYIMYQEDSYHTILEHSYSTIHSRSGNSNILTQGPIIQVLTISNSRQIGMVSNDDRVHNVARRYGAPYIRISGDIIELWRSEVQGRLWALHHISTLQGAERNCFLLLIRILLLK